jgi:prolyl-tRNA synthetase
LEEKGLRVNLDDRDIRPGKKFNDWELKGTPVKLELGPRDLENNITIAMSRDEEEKIEIALDENLADNVIDLLNKAYENLSAQALAFQEEHVKFANSLDEVGELVESGNVVKFYWCGEEEVGHEIEEKTGYDVLGIQEEVSEGKCIASGKDAKYIALIAKTY